MLVICYATITVLLVASCILTENMLFSCIHTIGMSVIVILRYYFFENLGDFIFVLLHYPYLC